MTNREYRWRTGRTDEERGGQMTNGEDRWRTRLEPLEIHFVSSPGIFLLLSFCSLLTNNLRLDYVYESGTMTTTANSHMSQATSPRQTTTETLVATAAGTWLGMFFYIYFLLYAKWSFIIRLRVRKLWRRLVTATTINARARDAMVWTMLGWPRCWDSMVRFAQGMVHMGKGTIGLNPFFSDWVSWADQLSRACWQH
jgi:hypothetical protein